MHSALSATLAACLLLAAMSSTAAAQAAAPPAPQAGATGPDLSQPLEARIKYWVNKISKAGSRADIYDARRGLTLDFHADTGAEYVNTFATILDRTINPLLDSGLKADDPMLATKQINLAMALTMARHAAIEPSLEKMVVSPNVALRYMGWGGYRQIRPQLLTGGESSALELVATVSTASKTEESPMVVGAMFEAMSFSQGGTSAAMTNKVRQAVLNVLSQNWNTCCRQVLSADPAWADACLPAMPILTDVDAGLGADKATRKKVRQMMIDMAWCAATVYEKVDKRLVEVEAERAKANAPAGPAEGEPATPPRAGEGAGNPTPTAVARSMVESSLAQAKQGKTAAPAKTPVPAAKTPAAKPPAAKTPGAGQSPAHDLATEATTGGPTPKERKATSQPKVMPKPVIKRSIQEESLAELVLANASLLRSAETAMAAASGAARDPIRKALMSTDDKERGKQILSAVSEWVETFKDDGVHLPLESDFGPATSAPAAAPNAATK